jgi:hypothetical protein
MMYCIIFTRCNGILRSLRSEWKCFSEYTVENDELREHVSMESRIKDGLTIIIGALIIIIIEDNFASEIWMISKVFI